MSKWRITWAVRVVVLAASAAVAGCGSPAAPTPADPTGTWVGTAGNATATLNVTLVLTRVSSSYQGTVNDDQGRIARDTPVQNVTWDGRNLAFRFLMADGTGISVAASVSGDNMTGNYVDAQGERGSINCARRR